MLYAGCAIHGPGERPSGNGKFPAGTGAGHSETRNVRGGQKKQDLPSGFALIWRLTPQTLDGEDVDV